MKDLFMGIIFVTLFFVLLNFCFSVAEESQNIKNLETIITELQNQINLLKKSNYNKVTLSAYHPQSKGINSDKSPHTTATMKKPIAGYTLALSKELVDQGWLGQKIYIDGWGIGQATDRMDTSVKGKQIDICSPNLKHAKDFGIKKDVLAIVLVD